MNVSSSCTFPARDNQYRLSVLSEQNSEKGDEGHHLHCFRCCEMRNCITLMHSPALGSIEFRQRVLSSAGFLISSAVVSFQESPTSPLMIVDTECPATSSPLNATPELASCPLTQLDANTPDNSLPIYRSHIQKRHINLGRYYDGMMRAGTSQMPTHDLRCHLFSSNALPHASTDGVTEETVRQARLLLDSIPTGAQLKTDISEDGHEQ